MKRKFEIRFYHGPCLRFMVHVDALNEIQALGIAAEEAGINYTSPVLWVSDKDSRIEILLCEE